MSKIQWTDTTWNPVTGCTPCATGCKYCYAKEMHRRLRAIGQPKYQHDFSEVCCHPEELEKPLRWRKPRKVFVCSMSDLFHEDVPSVFRTSVFATMNVARQHTYQVLTKRPANARGWFASLLPAGPSTTWPLSNVWVGASASTQPDLERVVPDLLATPAAVRFLSLEPLLGPMVLRIQALCAHWIIIGAESGPHRRECREEWVRDIVAQCKVAGIPCFVKQIHRGGKVVKMPADYPQEWPACA